MRPASSFFEPTRYQRFTATVGVEGSCDRMTRKLFGNVYCSNGMLIAALFDANGFACRASVAVTTTAAIASADSSGVRVCVFKLVSFT